MTVKEYQHKWYIDNKKHVLNQQRERRITIRSWLNNYKSNCACKICGESDIRVLDFHHRNPEDKLFSVGQHRVHGRSLEAIKKEIEKCDVLCCNCHRKITHRHLV